MGDEDRAVWQKWQVWDRLRYKRDMAIRAEVLRNEEPEENETTKDEDPPDAVPAKRKVDEDVATPSFHIPKKKRPIA